ncbi:hypothetical protein A2U01_0059577, partial [Trifolium medium]|nr:hypothetical protein [Trifolium medium]
NGVQGKAQQAVGGHCATSLKKSYWDKDWVTFERESHGKIRLFKDHHCRNHNAAPPPICTGFAAPPPPIYAALRPARRHQHTVYCFFFC